MRKAINPMHKIYLDTCVWGRPFDNQSEKRISEETMAFFEIAWMIDSGEAEIISSEVLFAELEDIKDKDKMDRISLLVKRAASQSIELKNEIRVMALDIERACKTYGVDSLHIASAIIGGTDYFITTDDELVKKKNCIKEEFNINVINPTDFVRRLHA